MTPVIDAQAKVLTNEAIKLGVAIVQELITTGLKQNSLMSLSQFQIMLQTQLPAELRPTTQTKLLIVNSIG